MSLLKRSSRLRELKKQLHIDVSISFLEGADYINLLLKSGGKVVLSIRGSKRYDESMIDQFSWLRKKILIPLMYRRAERIVTVNHGIADELQNYYGVQKSRITVIGNFYDATEITRLSLEPKEENMNRLYSDPVLITTGRLAPEKGLRELLHVFHGIKKKRKNLRLVIVGDGPMLGELIQICNALKLVPHQGHNFEDLPDVVFLGPQSNVFKYLKGSLLYLLNSSSEGFPNGLAEAMICQVAVVSSDCPYGPREIMAPEFPFTSPTLKPYFSRNGILMPLVNSEESMELWIETLDDVLGKNTMLHEFAANGRERIRLFDQQSILPQWLEIIEASE